MRNPKLLGFQLPDMKNVAMTATGFIAPPFLEGFIKRYLPQEYATGTMWRYIWKVASVAGISLAARRLLGSEEGKYALIGGSTYIVASLVADYMPNLIASGATPSTAVSYYNPGRLAAQPFLGTYPGTGTPGQGLRSIPTRLSPKARF